MFLTVVFILLFLVGTAIYYKPIYVPVVFQQVLEDFQS
ncbi:hypothetical protein FSS13T_18860 [Flavobacterium saliperosum S13]|uniref:Uncharacterized protein n=1 Tax=Flavobacterium saliperosum S13 TaxID=1341155 RepID=A0ABP2ZZA9_9FLAO|nr:hypothetical protein FSS13T_18860 [Flavobacterium saliperosum S13]